ncbi:MAG TPA: zf-HC2 domain-containing protein [Vicinamibacterales bacterium]|nr:zf-HC2 domain-containing protein [Vicinamibacterales bacterium]
MTDRLSSEHLADEDIVLDYYGELDAADRDRVRTHLAWCADCQHVDRDVRATLRLVDVTPAPEPPASFEREMWARIEPHLRTASLGSSWTARLRALSTGTIHWPRLAWGGGIAAAMVLAFFVGRAGRSEAPEVSAARPAAFHAARERVLDAEVGDHFERSQRVLTDLVNIDPATPVVLASDQQRAADLVASGRVYRRTADALGERATSELLEDLERVLLDVANGSAEPTSREIESWRERIDQQDLVFRLRVVGAEMRRRQEPGSPTY